MLTLAAEFQREYRVFFACTPARAGQILLDRAQALGCVPIPIDATHSSGENRLRKWVREKHVDIFHSHAGISWEGHAAIRIARVAGATAIVRTEHLPYLLTDRQQQIEYAKVVDAVDRLICVSDEARWSFLRNGFAEEKFITVRNGIAPPRVPKTAERKLRAELKLPADAKIVLTVARFTEQKGHRHLLAAVPGVLAVHPLTHFVWVGSGPLLPVLQRSARDQGLEQHISFLGNRADVRDLMAEADVFVLPSEFEGLPLVLLEAMAARLPVVGTRVCGIREVICDGACGRLVAAADPGALKTAILEPLLDANKAVNWGQRGRERVIRAFTAHRMARETAAVYGQILPSMHPTREAPAEIFA